MTSANCYLNHQQYHHKVYYSTDHPRAEVEEFFHEMDRDFDGRLSFEVPYFIYSYVHISFEVPKLN